MSLNRVHFGPKVNKKVEEAQEDEDRLNKWHRDASRGVSVLYSIFINGTQMLTLRPHQQRITDRMLAYKKGQIIVPTGGGKTLTMIMDAQSSMNSIDNGVTTVVVAPRILLAEQLCS